MKYLTCPKCKKHGLGKVKRAMRFCKYCGSAWPAHTWRAALLGLPGGGK